MKVSKTVFLALVVVCIAIPNASYAQGKNVDHKAIDKAVESGVKYLKGLVKSDGSFTASGQHERPYPEGTTALVLFALLKSGIVGRNDRVIIHGFNYLRKRPFKAVYSVSLLILALEARYAPKPKPAAPKPKKKKDSKVELFTVPSPPAEKVAKNNFRKKAPRQDRALLANAVKWLLAQQHKYIWRYPGGVPGGTHPKHAGTGALVGMEDFSNTQYTMLALNAARRLGCSIKTNVWRRVVAYALREQQKTGPEVKWFPVPAADIPIAKLREERDRYLRDLTSAVKTYNEQIKKARDEGKDPDAMGLTKDGPRTAVQKPNPYRDFGPEKHKMYARGWAYLPGNKTPVVGSMTTSGVAALVICKDALESAGKYKKVQKEVDQAIRDGCAWLAKHFTVSSNPDINAYHYYFLYGLERAGVLSLVHKFGSRDWYEEGVRYLLGAQTGDGSWPSQAPCSAMTRTCFALLFLKRATTPIVQEPEDIYTGTDLFGPRKPEK